MADRSSRDSPLEALEDAVGERTAEAFELLGNETRLAILVAFWDASDPYEDERTTLSFSELRQRVGMRDSGQFNYHLEQLVGHFIEDVGDGYILKIAGGAILQTVIAGSGIEKRTFGPNEIEQACPFCDAQTAVGYVNELVYQVCTQCEGVREQYEFLPETASKYGGMLYAPRFAPAGLADRGAQEVFNATVIEAILTGVLDMTGVCSRCSGTTEASLNICDQHDLSDGNICPNCRFRWEVRPQFTCTVCKHMSKPSPVFPVIVHPTVIDFYAERGITIADLTDPESIVRMEPLMKTQYVDLVSRDPAEVQVTFRHENDEVKLTYDENVNIIGVN